MIKKLISIVCFVMVVSACGCQEQKTSVNPGGTLNQQTVSQADKTIVIAYYFHRTIRCKTCIDIESNAERVIKENFAKELADGQLTWMPLNLEESNGQKLAKEFDVFSSTLVIAKMKGDNPTEYKKLEKVWDLLGNPEEFSLYVTEEVNEYLQ